LGLSAAISYPIYSYVSSIGDEMKVKRSKTWHKISKNRLPQDTGGAPRASQNYYVIMGQSIIGILVESFGCMNVQHCVGKEAQIFQIL